MEAKEDLIVNSSLEDSCDEIFGGVTSFISPTVELLTITQWSGRSSVELSEAVSNNILVVTICTIARPPQGHFLLGHHDDDGSDDVMSGRNRMTLILTARPYRAAICHSGILLDQHSK